jgi:PAS domain S-box-containing protein
MQSQSPQRRSQAIVVITLAYALLGWAALVLAVPPGYAAPLFPASGVALVGVLIWGRALLPGITLAAFAVALGALWGATDADDLARIAGVAAAIALGVALQTTAGVWLLTRRLPQPLQLTELRDVALFLLFGAVLASAISASVAVAALLSAGLVRPEDAFFTWWTWWTGDALGVAVGAPVMLCFVGAPRELWRGRLRSVALPLATASVLVGAMIAQVSRWDAERAQARFDHDAATARNAVATQLETPLHALAALHGLFVASDKVTADEFMRATRYWTESPVNAQALGWAERLTRDQIPAFEAAVRRDGPADYAVFDVGPGGTRLAPQHEEVIPVRFAEPRTGGPSVLGVNALSVAASRDAIDAAQRIGQPVATAGIRLMADAADRTRVVVFRPVYRGQPTDEVERASQTRGFVFVSLRMTDLLALATKALPAYLRVCVRDTHPATPHPLLAGAAECAGAGTSPWRRTDHIVYAGRAWQIDVIADERQLPGDGKADVWLLSIAALAAVSLLGALLLTMTGHAQRIEVAVERRTADLQREIGERARTEAALRESEQRFRNILNHVPIGVFYTDLQGTIKESNPAFRELVGYGADELATMTSMEFTHPDERLENLELAGRLVRGEISAYRRQQRYITRDGGAVPTRSIVSLLRDAEGRPHRIVGVVEDITEHLRLQDAEAAREVAEAANRAKSDFLSRMSHELRTPLNAVLGFAQLIELDREHPLSESQRDWIGQIQTAGWHLLDMINDTLDLSRIEAGTLRLDIEPIELPQTVEATLAMVERAAQARDIVVTQTLHPDAAQVSGDATRVKQILTNLLSNAVKYNIEGGRIHIASRINGSGAVELAVSDTGLGMNAEQLAGLFQPFNRLGREQSAFEGTGIGLVISQRLAELMGGSLRARSTEGEGSSFILTLPRGSPPVGEPRRDEEVAAPLNEYHQRVVHYIEDNETNAVVMEGILTQRPQVRLKVSTTGMEALAAIRAQPPSLILLDMHLPDIEGLQLLRMLKDDVATAAIPVVVVSADAVAARIRAALDAGAERYLTKPVNVGELLRLIDELLMQRDTLFG